MKIRSHRYNQSLGVAYKKEVLEPVDDGVDGEDWLPVFPQDVETDIALQVNVGMVHLGLALHLHMENIK